MAVPVRNLWFRALYQKLSCRDLLDAPPISKFRDTRIICVTDCRFEAQGIIGATAYILTIAAPIVLLNCYVFVNCLRLGVAGIFASFLFNNAITFALLVLYTTKIEGSQGWSG
ncbi:hypothetical protein BDB00DRAFT_790456 [Zychaea mexicana]|uniref:uncharacterized protein n=1 Tax=Zychaea mexicana TaxID=64656 RepID=UPI0022FE37BD|nr:uncharacterized protein BDB00DRAFT_790456 [Zychaea mexicana]KAI9490303.1 hypothetical protein BDB00DRAFT_790456 [Zychaea mexicana]